MIQNRLAALLRIQKQPAFDFLHSMLQGMSPPDDEGGRELFALARERLLAAENAFNLALAAGDEEQILAATDEVVWAVMMLGNFFPPLEHQGLEAEFRRRRRADSQKAGQKSGRARRANAESEWHSHALQLAKDSRKVDRGWSQDDVADYMSTHWGKKIKRKSHATLKAFVSRCIRERKLPDKVR